MCTLAGCARRSCALGAPTRFARCAAPVTASRRAETYWSDHAVARVRPSLIVIDDARYGAVACWGWIQPSVNQRCEDAEALLHDATLMQSSWSTTMDAATLLVRAHCATDLKGATSRSSSFPMKNRLHPLRPHREKFGHSAQRISPAIRCFRQQASVGTVRHHA